MRKASGAASMRGVGMIEVLTAMVVVAVAVLGISRMQITMLQQNQSALLRSQATILAYDAIDRLRVDRQAALNGDYDRALGAARPTTTSVADNSINQWLDSVATTLPAGDGAIVRSGELIVVSIRWDDSRGALPALTFTTAVEL
ncbi:type IV pilus modification protein PilV [Congregibacter variabilis]|uniref:Type IV pilus modification protein PilV n=1 Tax=Congregibacter variabilis TaxID=3081200 RepID=A0ABZ0I1U0_9GAMM|nr:type IV pilus modification protein PilV [Congregibacter sp. IMCC43200]